MASGTVHSNIQLILFVLHMSIIAIITHFKFFSNPNSAMIAVFSMYSIATTLALVNFILFSIRKTRNAIPPIAMLIIMGTLFVLDLVNIILVYSTDFQLGMKCEPNTFDPLATTVAPPEGGVPLTTVKPEEKKTQNNDKNLVVYFTVVTMVLAVIEGLLLLFSPPSIGVSEKELERRRKMDEAVKKGEAVERAPGDEKKDESNEGEAKTPTVESKAGSKNKSSRDEKKEEKKEDKKEDKTEGDDKKDEKTKEKSKSQKSQKSSKKSNRKDP